MKTILVTDWRGNDQEVTELEYVQAFMGKLDQFGLMHRDVQWMVRGAAQQIRDAAEISFEKLHAEQQHWGQEAGIGRVA
jgi:hypothetical protein